MRWTAACVACALVMTTAPVALTSPTLPPDEGAIFLAGLPSLLTALGGTGVATAIGVTYDETPHALAVTGYIFGGLNLATAGLYLGLALAARPMNDRTTWGAAAAVLNASVAVVDFTVAATTDEAPRLPFHAIVTPIDHGVTAGLAGRF